MLNEEPNKEFHWKHKLDELDNLPGESFNKEVTWDKLHARIQGKSGNKRIIWYWAAAALMMLVIPLLTNHKNESPVANTEKSLHHPEKMNGGSSIDSKNYTVKRLTSDSSSKERIVTTVNKLTPQKDIIIRDKVITTIPFSDTVDKQMTTKIMTETLEPVDTFSTIAIVKPARKKLKVVHINELGDPVEESPVMVHNTEIHSFQLRLGNQEVFVNPSGASQAKGLTILKADFSPN
ncbi:MAG: hypothetical protein Q8891_17305 [Bacteroidota bacterium]|nr:hypothetical protein [Bacteroidota bacterium]